MNFLRVLPVFISFLLMSAHFLRAGQLVIAVALLCLLLLLLIRQYWVPWVIQLILLLGAVEWLLTLYSEVQVRIGQDRSWMRLAIILGVVALFTLLSCLVFRSKALRERYTGANDETLQ